MTYARLILTLSKYSNLRAFLCLPQYVFYKYSIKNLYITTPTLHWPLENRKLRANLALTFRTMVHKSNKSRINFAILKKSFLIFFRRPETKKAIWKGLGSCLPTILQLVIDEYFLVCIPH